MDSPPGAGESSERLWFIFGGALLSKSKVMLDCLGPVNSQRFQGNQLQFEHVVLGLSLAYDVCFFLFFFFVCVVFEFSSRRFQVWNSELFQHMLKRVNG